MIMEPVITRRAEKIMRDSFGIPPSQVDEMIHKRVLDFARHKGHFVPEMRVRVHYDSEPLPKGSDDIIASFHVRTNDMSVNVGYLAKYAGANGNIPREHLIPFIVSHEAEHAFFSMTPLGLERRALSMKSDGMLFILKSFFTGSHEAVIERMELAGALSDGRATLFSSRFLSENVPGLGLSDAVPMKKPEYYLYASFILRLEELAGKDRAWELTASRLPSSLKQFAHPEAYLRQAGA